MIKADPILSATIGQGQPAEILSPITRMEYAMAYCSFIPFLGLFFGMAAIILGSIKKQSVGLKLVMIGLAGIFFNIFLGFAIHHRMIAATRAGSDRLGASMGTGAP